MTYVTWKIYIGTPDTVMKNDHTPYKQIIFRRLPICFVQFVQFQLQFIMNTSLTFEVLLYLNSYYFGLFAVCEVGMNIAKYIHFNLEHFGTDFGILMAVFIVELFRVVLARKGNLTERKWPVFLAILLTIPSLAGVIYLMVWQSEVLRFEYIICSIQVGLQALEIITGIICLLPFCKTPEYY